MYKTRSNTEYIFGLNLCQSGKKGILVPFINPLFKTLTLKTKSIFFKYISDWSGDPRGNYFIKINFSGRLMTTEIHFHTVRGTAWPFTDSTTPTSTGTFM